MKTTTHTNRISVTFTAKNDTTILNKINEIVKKYNAQDNLYNNEIGAKTLSHDRTHFIDNKGIGGTVTFHSHSCDHAVASKELIALLESQGLVNELFVEVAKTHRADGTPYKCTQYFIEKA